MSMQSKIYTIIHAAASADVVNYKYYQVYAGATTIATINGVSVPMVAASIIDTSVTSIAGTNVYVLGEPIDVRDGPQTLNNYPTPTPPVFLVTELGDFIITENDDNILNE